MSKKSSSKEKNQFYAKTFFFSRRLKYLHFRISRSIVSHHASNMQAYMRLYCALKPLDTVGNDKKETNLKMCSTDYLRYSNNLDKEKYK